MLYGHLVTLVGDFSSAIPPVTYYAAFYMDTLVVSGRLEDCLFSSFVVTTNWSTVDSLKVLSNRYSEQPLQELHSAYSRHEGCKVELKPDALLARLVVIIVLACRTYPVLRDCELFNHFLAVLQLTVNRGDVIGLPDMFDITRALPIIRPSGQSHLVFDPSAFLGWRNYKQGQPAYRRAMQQTALLNGPLPPLRLPVATVPSRIYVNASAPADTGVSLPLPTPSPSKLLVPPPKPSASHPPLVSSSTPTLVASAQQISHGEPDSIKVSLAAAQPASKRTKGPGRVKASHGSGDMSLLNVVSGRTRGGCATRKAAISSSSSSDAAPREEPAAPRE